MKLIYPFLFALSFTFGFAQVQTPQPSPKAEVEQVVGLTKIKITYSRPSARGREIFGGLVPYGKIWRTGANKNTLISFEDDVTFGGAPIEAGTYALFTIPGEKKWDIILYGSVDNWGTPTKYDEKLEMAKISVPVEKIPFPVETFTIMFFDLSSSSSAQLSLFWSTRSVSITIDVPTDSKALKSIKSAIASGKMSENDYFSAAKYYLDTKRDITKAKTWIDTVVEMNKEKPKYWVLRLQSLIYAASGKKAKAIKIAKKSKDLAEKAGNMDYVKMNETKIKEWKNK